MWIIKKIKINKLNINVKNSTKYLTKILANLIKIKIKNYNIKIIIKNYNL